MASQDGRNFSFGLGLQDFLDFHSSRTGNSYSLVVGTDGSKVELIQYIYLTHYAFIQIRQDVDDVDFHRPEAFFEQVVLTNDDARFWLESRLAVVRKLQILRGYLGLTPKIWLLTGLYLITDAVTFSAYGFSSENAIGGAVPLPEPTQLTALLNLNIGSKVKLGRNAVVARGTQISGKKVWAAQWQRVDANYMSVAKWKDDMGVKRLKLLPLLSTQTVRAAPLEEQAAAEVTLAGDEETKPEGETDEMPSEEYWGLLDREVQKVEDDYADDDDEDNA